MEIYNTLEQLDTYLFNNIHADDFSSVNFKLKCEHNIDNNKYEFNYVIRAYMNYAYIRYDFCEDCFLKKLVIWHMEHNINYPPMLRRDGNQKLYNSL